MKTNTNNDATPITAGTTNTVEHDKVNGEDVTRTTTVKIETENSLRNRVGNFFRRNPVLGPVSMIAGGAAVAYGAVNYSRTGRVLPVNVDVTPVAQNTARAAVSALGIIG